MSTTSNPFSAAQAMAAFNQMNASSPFNTQGQQLLSQGLTKKQANQQSAQAFSAAVQAANPHLDFSKRVFNNMTGMIDPYQEAEDYYRLYGTGMPQTPGGGVGVDPVTGQYRFDSPVSAPIAPQRIGNEPTEQQENPNSAAAQLGALSSANTSPTGSMFANQSIPNFAQAPMQQAAPIPLNSSPTALARMGSTANTRQAFIAPQTAAPAQIPTLGGFGQMPNLSQMLGTASQTPMTGSAFGQAGGAFPSTPGNYGGGASGGMALEGRYGIASGNSTPFPIQGNVSVVKLAQGGDVSKARQMLQNLTSPVQHFAGGSEVVPAGFRRSLFTGELVPIAATVEQLTDIYRGGEAQRANADAVAKAIAAAETPVQASPAVSAAPAPETRLSLFTNEPVPVNASVQDLTNIYSDYSFPSEPAAPETRLSLFTNEPVPVNASVQDLIDINSDYSFPSEPAASTTTASPSTVAQDIATLSSGEKQPSTAASDLLDLSKVASPAPGPSAAAVTSATIGEPPTSQGPDAVALASELGIPTFQVVSLLNQGLDASAIRNRYAIPVSVATDLMQRSMTGGVDTSEFDRLGGYERVKEVYDAAGGSYTPPFGQKPVVPPPPLDLSKVASPAPSNLSEGLQYATGEGGIGADKYYENIRNFVNTQGADLNAAEVRAEMDKWGVSDKDVRDALAGTQYSGAAIHALLNPDIGAADAPGRGVGGLEGMSANIRDFIQDQVAAKMTREQLGDVLTQQLGAYNPETGVGGFNEQDLIRATGKTASQLLNDLYGVNQKPPPVVTTVVGAQGNDTIKGAQGNDLLFQPPPDLPPLTDIFVPPTAPPPEAPPVALTPGQEGLDPSTAIVGATPIENRVARVTETAINKIPESERVTIPQLDTEFRASAPRTAIYDRFGRITGYTYSPAAKLTPATGTNVFNFVPPGITSRPRSLLNIGDVPGVTIDPVTGQLTMPLSASQRFARDRAELDNQFRRLYARAAETDTSLPTQAPSTAAAAFRQFAMNDPTMSAQLRMRNIEQTPTVSPTASMVAARSEYGAAPYAAALAEAFDPFLARNRASLLASKDMQRSYFERYPDLVAEYEKNWSKTMTPEEYAAYHYRTLGQKEGRTPPNLMGSPYTQQFFSKGGEASTEDFIKKQSGGDVSRETASPNTAEVPQVDTEGRLIDEREEIRSESQRMLNRLQSQPSKLPPGIKRTVAATKEQGKESMFPAAAPARDLLSGILGASPTAPGSEAYRTGQAIANMPPVQAAAAIPAKIAASAGDAATALAAMGPAVGAVMKPKGGNWLAPSVERGLNYLIPRTGAGNRTAKETLEEMNRTYPAEELARMPETRAIVDRAYQWLEPNVAIQNWIEKKLTKYVKNEMATPEDPVRALAERGILHVDPEQLNSYPGAGNPANQAVSRRALGYPEEGLAKSEAAKRWETASDYMIQTDRALNLLNPKEYGQGFVDQTLAANPWLTKVDPYERVYGVDTLNYRPDYSELGFDHLIDELKNSLNPNSGLPRALQLTPKQLDKVSVPQAVELVDKINKWRAEQKAAADLKRSQNAATVEYKAYDTVPGTAEPNKRGLRWVELKPATMSEDFVAPDRYSIVRPTPSSKTFAIQDSETGKYITTGLKSEEQARKHLFDTLNRQQLEDALKYEGEVMGHCVGGYCPDVEVGRSRIYSLRDAKGEPHVTIEVKPNPYAPRWEVVKGYLSQAEEMMRARGITNAREEEISELATQLAKENMPPLIQQIKGKANRAPKDEYLPFVQDFVKSGNWSEVNDLQNTGLIVVKREQHLPGSTIKINPGYYTLDELRQLAVDNNMSQDMLNEWMRRLNAQFRSGAYKDGGEVNVSRETSTSKQQLDKLAQVSKRKKA